MSMMHSRHHKGFTLIELLIAIAISLIIISAVLTMFTAMSSSNIDYLKSVRLNHELRAVMSVMVRDLRRAGHNQDAAAESIAATSINPYSNSAGGATVQATVLSVSGSNTTDRTVRFSYDRDDDANVEAYGYRLNVTGGVGAIEYCNSDAATNGAACTNWQDLTDSNLIDIDFLDFELDTIDVASGTLTIRQLTITMTGTLISDPDFTRTISEVIKIRNDHSANWAM
jgi:prepilin-type N-terminal cleavage/methylation domain-containing protein